MDERRPIASVVSLGGFARSDEFRRLVHRLRQRRASRNSSHVSSKRLSETDSPCLKDDPSRTATPSKTSSSGPTISDEQISRTTLSDIYLSERESETVKCSDDLNKDGLFTGMLFSSPVSVKNVPFDDAFNMTPGKITRILDFVHSDIHLMFHFASDFCRAQKSHLLMAAGRFHGIVWLLVVLGGFFGGSGQARVRTRPVGISTVSHAPTLHALPHLLVKRSHIATGGPGDIGSMSNPLIGARLKLSLDGETYFVHLTPNTDFIHALARMTVHADNGSIVDVLDLNRMSHRFYDGRVLSHHHSDSIALQGWHSPFQSQDVHVGWARLTVVSDHHPTEYDGNQVVVEGILSIHDQMVALKTLATFHAATGGSYAYLFPPDTDPDTLITYKIDSSSDNGHLFLHHDLVAAMSRNQSSIHQTHVHSCGADTLHFNQLGADDYFLQKHQDNSKHILSKRAESGCPTIRRFLYMAAAGDCTYVQAYGSEQKALTQILSDWNQASKLYESNFNVGLGLISVQLRQTCNQNQEPWNRPCSDSYTLNDRLSDFSKWRGGQSSEAGLWHLMTKCSSGPTVGVAWLNTLCETSVFEQNNNGKIEYVSGTGVSSINANEWMVVAHEIGHNFGAVHDCTASLCPTTCSSFSGCTCCPCTDTCDCRGAYIMNPTSDVKNPEFSPCAKRFICLKYPSFKKCLTAPGSKTLVTGQQCGNGIKEPGEQCDCGPATGNDCLQNNCCDGATCKFKNGAQCDDLNDPCCQTCKFKSAGTTCRPSQGVCDKAEACAGNSGDCPEDAYVDDLTSCAISSDLQGQCASGQCTSRDYQCQLRGTAADITKECPSTSSQCLMTCQDPTSSNVCLQLSGFFIDGTPCGYNGKCQNGACSQSDIGRVLSWLRDHLAVTISLAFVLLLVLMFCVSRCFSAMCNKKARSSSRTQLRMNRVEHTQRSRTAIPGYVESSSMDNLNDSSTAGLQQWVPVTPSPPQYTR